MIQCILIVSKECDVVYVVTMLICTWWHWASPMNNVARFRKFQTICLAFSRVVSAMPAVADSISCSSLLGIRPCTTHIGLTRGNEMQSRFMLIRNDASDTMNQWPGQPL